MGTRKKSDGSALQTAFVFAGGGSLGAVQVGMLKAVMQTDLAPDFVVGASVGAINGAFFAADPTARGVEKLENIWLGIRRSDVFPIPSVWGVFGFLYPKDHLCSPMPLTRLIEQHIEFDTLEDTMAPCHIVTTDLFTGNEVTLSVGPAVDAMLASSAIPGVFPPVRIGDNYLIDGGVTNNTPISVAVAKGATRVVVFPTGISCARKKPPRGVIEMAMQTMNIAISHRLWSDVQQFKDRVEIIMVPVLCPLDVSIFNFSRTAELINRAEENVGSWIEQYGIQPGMNIDMLKPHYH